MKVIPGTMAAAIGVVALCNCCVHAPHTTGDDATGVADGALEYHFGNDAYFLIASTDHRVFLELRSYADDRILTNIVLWSRYMVPRFEPKDVALDDKDEFLVWTRGGGTGISETHLTVYALNGTEILELGDFVTDRTEWPSRPESTYQEELSGHVTFPKKDELAYGYHRVVTQDGTATVSNVVQRYVVNPKTMRYEMIGEPESAHAGDGVTRAK